MSKFALLRRRVFGVGLGAFTICTLTFGSLAAAPLPQPPADTEVMVRVLSSERNLTPTQRARILRHPLWRLLGSLPWSDSSDVELHSVVEMLEGTAVFGIRSRADGTSSLVEFFKDRELRHERASLVSELESLTEDLVYYQTENERFPADYQTYIDEERYYGPYLPDGYDVRYRPAPDGSRFELSVEAPKDAELLKLGPLPTYRSGVGFENLQPTKSPPTLNFIGGLKVNDPASAKRLLEQILGPSQGGLWRREMDGGVSLVVTLRGDWLAMSDRQQNLSELFETLNGRKPGLAGRPTYRTVARNIDVEAPLFFYFDPSGLVGLMDQDDEDLPAPLAPFVQAAGPMGYSFIEWPQSQMKLEAFLSVNPPENSALASFMQASANAQPGQEMIMANVPWDAGNVFCVDYRNSKELLDSLVELVPNASVPYEMGQDIFAGFLGLDAEKGFNHLLKGPMVVSFERIDVIIGFIEQLMEEPSYDYDEYSPEEYAPEEYDPSSYYDEGPTGIGGPVEPEADVDPEADLGDGETEAEGEIELESDEEPLAEIEEEVSEPAEPGDEDPAALPVDDTEVIEIEVDGPNYDQGEGASEAEDEASPKDEMLWLPFTVACQLGDLEQREALVAALERVMGSDVQDADFDGYPGRTRSDGRLSYCLHNDWLYISGGKTERLMMDMLAAADGRASSLESVDSWSRFRLEQRGRLIAYGHQKVDAWYSMVKGALLFLGPEFRPIADELGEIRDYHTSLTVVPDGLLITGEVLRADGR